MIFPQLAQVTVSGVWMWLHSGWMSKVFHWFYIDYQVFNFHIVCKKDPTLLLWWSLFHLLLIIYKESWTQATSERLKLYCLLNSLWFKNASQLKPCICVRASVSCWFFFFLFFSFFSSSCRRADVTACVCFYVRRPQTVKSQAVEF